MMLAPSASTARTRHESTLTAIEQHGARAALADEAALLRAGQPEVVAQDLEQRVVRRDLDVARAAPLTVSSIGVRDRVMTPASRAIAVATARSPRTWSIARR